jgi:hypothetical protein
LAFQSFDYEIEKPNNLKVFDVDEGYSRNDDFFQLFN